MNNFIKKNLTFIIAIFLSITVVIGFFSYILSDTNARYVSNNSLNYYIESNNLYLSSNLLKENGNSEGINSYRYSNIDFTISNTKYNNITNYDIEYKIECSSDNNNYSCVIDDEDNSVNSQIIRELKCFNGDNIVNLNNEDCISNHYVLKPITKTNNHHFKIVKNNNDDNSNSVEVTLTATTLSPFKMELSSEVVLYFDDGSTSNDIYVNLLNDNNNICQYEIKNTYNEDKYVSVSIDSSKFLFDSTDKTFDNGINNVYNANNEVNSIIINTPTLSSNIITLYKKNSSDVCSSDDINTSQTNISSIYSITYNANNGSGTMSQSRCAAGSNCNVKYNGFYRNGYVFARWNTSSNGYGTSYNPKQEITNMSRNVTVYAQWTKATYNIKYDSNGGSGTITQSNCTYNTNCAIKNNSFTKTNYTFDSWNTSPDGTGISYNGGQTIPYISKNVTLYAIWDINKYNITYNSNGGSGTMTQTTCSHGTSCPISNNEFTKSGYLFNGWNTAANGSGTSYSEGQSIPNISGNVTLYAKWKEKVYILDKTKFRNFISTNNPTEIYFVNTGSGSGTNIANDSGDSIYAWMNGSKMYVSGREANNNIMAPVDSSELFKDLNNVKTIDVTYLDTSNVTNMYAMFMNTGYNVSNFNIIGMDDWNTSKVTNMSYLFYDAGFNATTYNIGDLSDWDTNKVTDLSYSFYDVAINASSFNISGIKNWDISNVTNMQRMFWGLGANATTFNLDLSGWDARKVTSMEHMFYGAGGYSNSFNLNLSNWNTSSLENMYDMFNLTGFSATTFTFNMSGWDTGNVTNMSTLFYAMGNNANSIYLDLSSWDVSNVTTTHNMFNCLGEHSSSIYIDISTWELSNTTDMDSMFWTTGTDASSWTVKIKNDGRNTATKLCGSGSTFAGPASGKRFTLDGLKSITFNYTGTYTIDGTNAKTNTSSTLEGESFMIGILSGGTFTVTSTNTNVDLFLVGGGGGGAGAPGYSSNASCIFYAGSSGGGGGGYYSVESNKELALNTSYTITIGAGGGAGGCGRYGGSGSPGSRGGTTSFVGSSFNFTAAGGYGGEVGDYDVYNRIAGGGAGGAGGTNGGAGRFGGDGYPGGTGIYEFNESTGSLGIKFSCGGAGGAPGVVGTANTGNGGGGGGGGENGGAGGAGIIIIRSAK